MTLVVAARDQGLPPLEDTITIVIAIEDVNDFAPFFEEESYEASVREGARTGFGVTQVVAMDADEGLGARSLMTSSREGMGIFTSTHKRE